MKPFSISNYPPGSDNSLAPWNELDPEPRYCKGCSELREAEAFDSDLADLCVECEDKIKAYGPCPECGNEEIAIEGIASCGWKIIWCENPECGHEREEHACS